MPSTVGFRMVKISEIVDSDDAPGVPQRNDMGWNEEEVRRMSQQLERKPKVGPKSWPRHGTNVSSPSELRRKPTRIEIESVVGVK